MKQRNEIDGALREVAKLRDGQLRAAPALSPERRAVLTGFLLSEFPVEAALHEVAAKRDQLLNPSRQISAAAKATLHRQLFAAKPLRDEARGWRAVDWRFGDWIWPRIFRSPPGAVLLACAMVTTAILCFGKWGTPLRHNGKNFSHSPRATGVTLDSGVVTDRAELFTRKAVIGPFNLNTNEPASLQASFVAHNGVYLADGAETPLGLRLDLPRRAILSDDNLARTP